MTDTIYVYTEGDCRGFWSKEPYSTGVAGVEYVPKAQADAIRDAALCEAAETARKAIPHIGPDGPSSAAHDAAYGAAADVMLAILALRTAPSVAEEITLQDRLRAEIDRANVKQAAGWYSNDQRNAVVNAIGRVWSGMFPDGEQGET